MYSITFYVPAAQLEPVKQAMFLAGAGTIGNYDSCCWQICGAGQFRPLLGSTPTLGKLDTLTRVTEYRVEMVVATKVIEAVVQALKQSHPYEEPAYQVVRLEPF